MFSWLGGGGVQIREGGSKSASGYGPGGPNPLADLDRGVQIRGGSKSAVTPETFSTDEINVFSLRSTATEIKPGFGVFHFNKNAEEGCTHHEPN